MRVALEKTKAKISLFQCFGVCKLEFLQDFKVAFGKFMQTGAISAQGPVLCRGLVLIKVLVKYVCFNFSFSLGRKVLTSYICSKLTKKIYV